MNTSLRTYITDTQTQRRVSDGGLTRQLLANYLPIFLILMAATLGAIQIRLQIASDPLLSDAAMGSLVANIGFDTPMNGDGWHLPEGGTMWMSNSQSLFMMKMPVQDYQIAFQVFPLLPEFLDNLSVTANGQEVVIEMDELKSDWRVYRGIIPASVIAISPENTQIAFNIDRVVSPQELGIGGDNRQLGLRFDWLRIGESSRPVVQPILLFGIIIVSAFIAPLFISFTPGTWSTKHKAFIALMLALLCATALIMLFIPEIAAIQQLSWFVILTLIIGLMTILWTPQTSVGGKPTTLLFHLRRLWENRVLLVLWTRYNVLSRYSQAMLGILWIVIQPLATSIVLAFVFSRILRVIDTGGAPYISFYLAAIIPWTLFSAGLSNGAASLIGASGLITQVYFPREIIVLVKLGETLVDVAFTFIAMMIINAVLGIYPNVNFIYIPLLVLLQIAFMMGVMLFTSYLSMMIRDVPQLISIILQFMFYLTPILYPVEILPQEFSFMALINPLAPLVKAYRDIILFGNAPDPVSLYYPLAIAGVLLYTGYMFFKQNEKRVADYI